MKNVSIGYLFWLIWLLNGEQAAPQLDPCLQQVGVNVQLLLLLLLLSHVSVALLLFFFQNNCFL